MNLFKLNILLSVIVVLAGCEQVPESNLAASEEGRLDYNWDIRPILSNNCFACHGTDPAGVEAGLRLDLRSTATAGLPESPGKFAIVAGRPDQSELVNRIRHADPDVRMPPLETHKTLSEKQISTLELWIEQGAEYKGHWAFIEPKETPLPSIIAKDAVITSNGIDSFILDRLKNEGLKQSSLADKETLINRVSLTLTGLPPTLEEVDAYVNNNDPDAYEQLVDKLLASEQYGENMAAYWMDLSRWADSDGYLDDPHDRFLWPWRDWVIKAFNDNIPFDEFGTVQIAGDLKPNASKEDILATAFLRVGRRNTENGSIDEEYVAEYMMDRTDTISTAFLGLTAGCARCHDHRYDPISIKDYYSMGAFFHNMDEPGFYAPGWSGVQTGPTLLWPDEGQANNLNVVETALEQEEVSYKKVLNEVNQEMLAKAKDQISPVSEVKRTVESSLRDSLDAYFSFDETLNLDLELLPSPELMKPRPASLVSVNTLNWGEDGLAHSKDKQPLPRGYREEDSVLVSDLSGNNHYAIIQGPLFEKGFKGNALYFTDLNKGVLTPGGGRYERSEAFSVDLRFKVGQDYPHMVPIISDRDNDNSGGKGWRLTLEADGRIWLHIAHSRPANMIALYSKDPVPVGEWLHITVTYDGSSKAAGTKLYLNGELADTIVDHDSLTRTIVPTGWATQLGPYYSGASFGIRFREKPPIDSAIDELRFYSKALTSLEIAYLENEDLAVEKLQTEGENLVYELLLANNEDRKAAFNKLVIARTAQNDVVSQIPEVLVAGESPTPRETHILERGVYSNIGEEVTAKGFEQIFPWDDSLPQNRTGLTQWLFDPSNPLTSRVWVNRLWQQHFGQGLVETSEDFGTQGANPSHPELLEWLSRRFLDSGWDTKAMQKLIVMSATYRQESKMTDELLAKDPGNKFLARGPSRRMTFEMIRDGALFVSDLLDKTIGGPSVHPYQPPDIWNPLNGFYQYPDPEEVPDEQHRRSIYSYKKRNAMHPGMLIFDAADPSVSKARRASSNTPLQSLKLMNDPQYLESYRVLAERVIDSKQDRAGQFEMLYRLAIRKYPTQQQVSTMDEFYHQQFDYFSSSPEQANDLLDVGVLERNDSIDVTSLAAMTNVAAMLMNSPDAYTIR